MSNNTVKPTLKNGNTSAHMAFGVAPTLANPVATGPSATELFYAAEIARLTAENDRLTKQKTLSGGLKVSEKGGLSVYGLGRFPITLYKEQWVKLLALADEIREFIKVNDSLLKTKPAKE